MLCIFWWPNIFEAGVRLHLSSNVSWKLQFFGWIHVPASLFIECIKKVSVPGSYGQVSLSSHILTENMQPSKNTANYNSWGDFCKMFLPSEKQDSPPSLLMSSFLQNITPKLEYLISLKMCIGTNAWHPNTVNYCSFIYCFAWEETKNTPQK